MAVVTKPASAAAAAVAPGGDGTLASRVARSSLNLAFRQAAVTVINGVAAIVITRLLGPAGYGDYASAIATWTLLGAASDFGFSLLLARDLGSEPTRHAAMLRAAYAVATPWALLLALAEVGLGFASGAGTPRGTALLVLAPAMAVNGLTPARSYFLATYRTATLARIDTASTLIGAAGMVAAAATGLGAAGVAGAVCVSGVLVTLIPAAVAQRHTRSGDCARHSRAAIVRGAAPLGLLALMTKVYMTIDLALLGWMVSASTLGNYAAAVKIAMLMTTVSGLVMTAALPALSAQAADPRRLRELMQRIWHWLSVTALPLFVAAALFAPLIVHMTVGSRYMHAAGLLRILALAGAISVMSNFLGVVMISLRRNRVLLIQNAVAIVVNVAGNVVLVPLIGVSASAWMTVATEALVCTGALLSMRGALGGGDLAAVSRRPLAATLVAAGTGALLMGTNQALALAGAALVFVATMSASRAWPHEFALRNPLPRLARL